MGGLEAAAGGERAYLAGVEDQLDQLGHQGVSHGQRLEVGVHQGSQQHWKQMAQHGGFGHLLQTLQPAMRSLLDLVPLLTSPAHQLSRSKS